jgi:hypothetical protein
MDAAGAFEIDHERPLRDAAPDTARAAGLSDPGTSR